MALNMAPTRLSCQAGMRTMRTVGTNRHCRPQLVLPFPSLLISTCTFYVASILGLVSNFRVKKAVQSWRLLSTAGGRSEGAWDVCINIFVILYCTSLIYWISRNRGGKSRTSLLSIPIILHCRYEMMGSCPGTRFLMFSQRSSQSKWPVRVVRGYEVLNDMGCVTGLYLKQTSLTKPVRKMSTMYRYDGLYQVDRVSISHGFSAAEQDTMTLFVGWTGEREEWIWCVPILFQCTCQKPAAYRSVSETVDHRK